MVIEISSWMYDVVDVYVFNVNSIFFKSHYWELEFHLPSPQHSDSATGYMLSSSSDGLLVDMLCHRRQRQVKRKVVWTNQTDIIDELPQYRSILYTYTGCELPYGFDFVEPKTTYYGRFLLNLYKFRNRCMHFSLCTLELVCVVCVDVKCGCDSASSCRLRWLFSAKVQKRYRERKRAEELISPLANEASEHVEGTARRTAIFMSTIDGLSHIYAFMHGHTKRKSWLYILQRLSKETWRPRLEDKMLTETEASVCINKVVCVCVWMRYGLTLWYVLYTAYRIA